MATRNRHRARVRRRVLLAMAGICLMLGAVFGVTWIQRQVLFPRAAMRPGPVPDIDGLERLWMESPEGPVEAWLLPARTASSSRPGPAVVYAHGNGELIDHWPAAMEPYRNLGLTVVLAEYRGYGRSAGRPSEAAIARDLRALHARLVEHPLIDADRLIYHGRSLGGGAVCTLLRTHPPRGVILESTFTSVPDVARGMGVPAFLIADKFESLATLREYEGPVLVMHGRWDRVIPVEHGKRLAAAHPRAEIVLYDCGHNDLPPARSDYWARIESLVQRSGVLRP